jgi:hypothetical protein
VSEFECKNRNVEMLWNNLKKCVLGIMRNVAGRVEEKKTRKPWIAQDITSQMDEGSGRM